MSLPFLQSSPDDKVVIIEGFFKAPIDRVYRAWIEPSEMMQWFGPGEGLLLAVECDLRVGGQICFEYKTDENLRNAIEGEYLVIEPERKLVFSWSHIVMRPDGKETSTPKSKVTVIFEKVGSNTKVRLSHEGIIRRAGREGVSMGWDATFARLGALVVSEGN